MTQKDTDKKLSTESYKGVRDFYPADLFVQHYIFNTWRKAVQSFGYEEYDASVLENSEIYKAKSGQELVNEQTYTFIDRGEREVTLRPEMTPTLARMVAAKKRELGFPLRLFSIPNCFRYERPQRGRLREFWQLNVDLLLKNTDFNQAYEVEIIKIVNKLMLSFGATSDDFEIRINSRTLVERLNKEFYQLSDEDSKKFYKLQDRKNKMSPEEFKEEAVKIIGQDKFEKDLKKEIQDYSEFKYLILILDSLKKQGITNVVFSPDIMRGLDYYTGFVFEVFDKDPQNNRALFGGGRYDNLVDMYDGPKDDITISGIGFGCGDVAMINFLETRNLIPKYKTSTEVLIASLGGEGVFDYINEVAEQLRTENKNVAVNYTPRKYPDAIKLAEKLGIQNVIVIGEDEAREKKFEVKKL